MYVTSIVLQLFFLLCHGTLFFIHDEEVRGSSINVVLYAVKTISDYQKKSINLILVIEVLKPSLSAH
jgi:hypothetical protein